MSKITLSEAKAVDYDEYIDKVYNALKDDLMLFLIKQYAEKYNCTIEDAVSKILSKNQHIKEIKNEKKTKNV